MTREEKAVVIEELQKKLQSNVHFYITDTGGLSVAQINEFRKLCFDKGLEYQVVKNTLIAKALESLETDYTPFKEEVLKGFSGIIFAGEAANLPAKVIKDYRSKGKDRKKPLLKGASIDSDLFIGDENLETLSSLKSKQELIADVVALLQSPAKNVVGALQSGGHKISGILQTLSDR
ncbi:50S ribosomal protein L10 [Roseivirga sp. BDSF3-8]|uniref:50S ribosomal protein L10 n=1 Tax=Roseivirga sp. BDSF3-8 TaxID=3241598 RepID=UPI0035321B91